MEVARPVLSSQRCAPVAAEYSHGGRHARQPLGESTGNAQQPAHSSRAARLCSQSLSILTTVPPSIPTPPVVPTQSFDLHYGRAAGNPRLRQYQVQAQMQGQGQGRRQRHGINPIYLSAGFQAYRRKQAEKDAQIWPDILEDAFLDGEWGRAVLRTRRR